MSISIDYYQNHKFVCWNRQKSNLFRLIFISTKISTRTLKSLLIVCISNYWILINSIFFMKMILSWWWTIIKSELESWIVSFNIQCKKSQSTSVINKRCRSMRYFIFKWTWSTRFWKFIMSLSNSRFHFAAIFEFMLSFEIIKRFNSTISNFMRHKSLSFRVIKLVLSSFFKSSFNDKDR
jgi:hypothetical protein